MQPTIIEETKDYIILNKPAGLMVHGDGISSEPTLVDWIMKQYPDIVGIGEDMVIHKGGQEHDGEVREIVIKRPGIVHRLDRYTSGVMIVARTQEFFDHIKRQFQDHEVQKVYRAYLYGHVKNDRGIIDAAIGRSSSDIRQWSATRGARGQLREAVTEYTVLQRGIASLENESYTYIEFKPKTGRTHQIRVHAKYLNHPVVADELYAGKLCAKDNLGFTRQALHALRITFQDSDGEKKSFEAPLPEDFINAQQLLR